MVFELPPPEKRLCKIHGRPVSPSKWRSRRRTTGCSRCSNTEPGYLKRKHRYETSARGKALDRRHKASKGIDKIRRGMKRPAKPIDLFSRLTGLSPDQMNFPRR